MKEYCRFAGIIKPFLAKFAKFAKKIRKKERRIKFIDRIYKICLYTAAASRASASTRKATWRYTYSTAISPRSRKNSGE